MRAEIRLEPDDELDIYLPDGRHVYLDASGEVGVNRYGEFPREGHAVLTLPDPELSTSDHMGFRWDVVKTRKRR